MSGQDTEAVEDKPEILVVDDSKVIRKAAVKMLGADYIIHDVADGCEAWQSLEDNPSISVVFTDIQMPVMNGMELLAKIRASENDQLAALPVIMITGADDTDEIKREVFDAGATDFITKPFGSIDLISRAKAYAQLNRKVVELEKQTSHDKLTGLFNANSLEEMGDKAVSFAYRHKLNISAAYIEIDGFQDIFLRNGKSVAQQIIKTVAKRMGTVLRSEDVAARVGVARFALLLPLTNSTHARMVVDRIRESINKLVFDTGKEKIRIVLAAGLTTPAITAEMSFSELLTQSDVALKRASSKVGNKVASFCEESKQPRAETDDVVGITQTFDNADLMEALKYVLNHDYDSVDRTQLDELRARLSPFLEYIDNQNSTGLTGTAGSA